MSIKILLSDTQVPDIFISDYMPDLDGGAVKLYLLALQIGGIGERVETACLRSRLGADAEHVASALVQLESRGLIRTEGDGAHFEVTDLKRQELETYYRPVTSRPPSETAVEPDAYEARRQMVQAISQTFFHQMMSPGWYMSIDRWFDEYQFTPEVVYALFQECSRRDKLQTKAYISRVADNWHHEGIRTIADLEAYWIDYERRNDVVDMVRKELNRPRLTRPEEDMVRAWVSELGFDEAMIRHALSRSTRATRPTLKYFDAILRNWYDDGILTEEDLKAADKAHREQRTRIRKLERLLNRHDLTSEDLKIAARWQEELGFDPEVIVYVVKVVSGSSTHPSLSYFDTAMRNYHAKGLHSLEAIEAYEAERKQKRQAGSAATGGARSGRRRHRSNFKEREYDEALADDVYSHAWEALMELSDDEPDADGTDTPTPEEEEE